MDEISVESISPQHFTVDRYWFLTWTTYGTWLPGDPRGCVTRVRDRRLGESCAGERWAGERWAGELGGLTPPARRDARHEHDIPGTPYDRDIPGLERAARAALKGPPIRLIFEQSLVLFYQFQETARYRCWRIFAVGIMANHLHIVAGVPGDPEPDAILGDFKSYGSRALNQQWTRPASGTWWTESGSKRKLAMEDDVLAAIRYVVEQEYPLLIWTTSVPELGLVEGFRYPPQLATHTSSGGREPTESTKTSESRSNVDIDDDGDRDGVDNNSVG